MLHVLARLILSPLELFFDFVFSIAYRITENPGVAIIFLSLAMNLLVLPLYKRADALQEEEQNKVLKMQPGVDHIKKVFKGDERFMILQTFYRQNDYKPYYALKGSLSLLLEIPFFIAAYRFLSSLKLLQGASLGPIADLGKPDTLITIGALSIHLLPILMTVINFISGAIYTKGLPLKSKLQLYIVALVFLVFLYDSPSGLVFYWTLNNLFSLCKNIVMKTPLFAGLSKEKDPEEEKKKEDRTVRAVFFISCISLTILLGILIPSAVIKASPAEFVELTAFRSPLRYVFEAFLISAGTFLVWFVIFYNLAEEKARIRFSLALLAISLIAIVDFMFFGKGYGTISTLLVYDIPISIKLSDILINAGAVIILSTVIVILWKKKQNIAKTICLTAAVALFVLSIVNVTSIQAASKELKARAEDLEEEIPEFTLSKNGKNVVVIMLDRAVNGFVPFLFQENPTLATQFAGFTYYPNTFSYGHSTNVGSPPLFGGYEYTPFEMNKRNDKPLVEKHNEALKLMPVIFSDNGYNVTVCDQPYGDYQWDPDLSIYDEYPDIHKYITKGAFDTDREKMMEDKDSVINRNLFCYSIFRISPLVLQKPVYNEGNYNRADGLAGSDNMTEEISFDYQEDSDFTSHGMKEDFLGAYRVLQNMPFMTKIDDGDSDNLLILCNDTTHDTEMLQEPEFEPKNTVDNTEYEQAHKVRIAPNGKQMELKDARQMQHFQCNMAAFIQLGNWLDYLRENDLYDNTRIIIVSDHGCNLELYKELLNNVPADKTMQYREDPMFYNPVLLIKDFGSTDSRSDDTFMTNADVPSEAMKGLIDNPVNPFTGNPVDETMKENDEQYAMHTQWDIRLNNGNEFFDPARITLRNHNILDYSNWFVEEGRNYEEP